MIRHWLFGAALVLAWGGYNWLRYNLAQTRLLDCDFIRPAIQRSICMREASEARDSVLTWALGVPLGLMIAAFAFLLVLRQVRK